MSKIFHLLLLSLIFFACKKTETIAIDPIKYTATIDLDKVVAGEMATIRFSQSIKKPIIQVNLNAISAKAYAINDSVYSLIVPVISAGDYNVTFQDIALQNKLNLSVRSYAIISQPQIVVDSFSTAINNSIDSLIKLANSPVAAINSAIIPFVKQLQEELNSSYTSLTADEKSQFAYFIRQNKIDFTSLTSSALPAIYYNTSTDNFRDPGEELIKVSQEFVARKIIAIGTIPVLLGTSALLVLSPNPLTAALFSASFLSYVIAREAAIKKAGEVGKLNGVVESILDISSNSQNQVTQFIKNQQASNTILSTTDIPSFKPDIAKIVTMTVEYRNLVKTDLGLHNNISAAIKGDEDFVNEDKTVDNNFQKVKSLLKKVNLNWISYSSKIPTGVTKKVAYKIPATSMLLKSVSDNRLTYTSSNADTGLLVKINSTVAENINFNMTIGYKSNLINKSIEKSFPAKYLGAIDTAAVLVSHGKWTAISGTDMDGDSVNVIRNNYGTVVGSTRVCVNILTAKSKVGADIQFNDGVLKTGVLNQTQDYEGMSPMPTLPNCTPGPFSFKDVNKDTDTFEWQYLPNLKVIRIKVTTPNNKGLTDTGVFLDLKIISFSSTKMELLFLNGIDNAPPTTIRYVFN